MSDGMDITFIRGSMPWGRVGGSLTERGMITRLFHYLYRSVTIEAKNNRIREKLQHGLSSHYTVDKLA